MFYTLSLHDALPICNLFYKRYHSTFLGGNTLITFFISLILLVVGYFTYGKFVEKVFGANSSRQTPANTNRDNVDYVSMKKQKNSMIQLINIAGKGTRINSIV